jgi:maltooligosyltrehalose trehalohydrolase
MPSSRHPFQPQRLLPIGADVQPGGGTHFRVWAPKCDKVAVLWSPDASMRDRRRVEMAAEADGYHGVLVPEVKPGNCYLFEVKTGAFPDPASRFQPEGPHGPSQVVDPSTYTWGDEDWRGVTRHAQVIYELHVGTFSAGGDWAGAEEHLPQLVDLGVTVLEVMPVADFPGRFGWGYDGVDLFAPTRLYGQPDEFRRFVDRAHQLGLGVILDVVYNHLGPDGNYLRQFADAYFTDRYVNEWGDAINFDGKDAGPVREFFIANIRHWISEYRLDGLRFDATQQMFDASADYIVAAMAREARAAAPGREVFLVAENELLSREATVSMPFGATTFTTA